MQPDPLFWKAIEDRRMIRLLFHADFAFWRQGSCCVIQDFHLTI